MAHHTALEIIARRSSTPSIITPGNIYTQKCGRFSGSDISASCFRVLYFNYQTVKLYRQQLAWMMLIKKEKRRRRTIPVITKGSVHEAAKTPSVKNSPRCNRILTAAVRIAAVKKAMPSLKIIRECWQIGLCVAALLAASGLSIDWGLLLLLLCPLIHLFMHRTMHADQRAPQGSPPSARAFHNRQGSRKSELGTAS